MKKIYVAIAAFSVALASAGCAFITPKSAEELVKKRAEDRWNFLVKGDFKKAYQYLQPGYKGLRNSDYYSQSIGKIGRWTESKIIDVRCNESVQKCEVKVKVNVDLHISAKPISTSTVLEEVWIYEENNWWKFEKL